MIRQKDTWGLLIGFVNERGYAPYPSYFATRRDAETIGRLIAKDFPESWFTWKVEKLKVYGSFLHNSPDFPEIVAKEIEQGWEL